ncbi:MAG TPA: 3-oxoacyl-[acyl-carrier-protein] synthase III C-terminal domain-containing protein [Nocardia sp.]|uniref:3-oxoacyl-ACP synthase III family protein n=1 Tax=Nocardia sp. TaxID=1821 RepID=UPI002B4B728F|nr:3-oxoacyl-[acyl-carrier-protein] synthase III C-terminal domain-containing protein [Nocardia sp.]HLS76611.1 3-oxoacyl-[acyl-carrier-protein] synthase III C-terminal domain-containing protein [Nocardia sp.]
MVRSAIEAVGAYLPAREVTTAELLSRLDLDAPPDLERASGVRARRVRGDAEDSFTIALAAALGALDNSRYDAADLDVIISCSITRTRGEDFCFEPSFALMLRTALGATRAVHFDVSNACAGMLTGVLLLDSMIRSGAARRGMVVSGECITPIADTAVREISQKYDPQFASLTVGDAGAAVVLDGTEGPGIDYVELNTSAAFAQLCLGMPSDQGPGVALYTDNRAMHNESRYLLWTSRQREFLAARGSSFADEGYDYVIHHQFSGPAVELIDKIAEREFGAPVPPGLAVLDKYGNTASTSHFVVLHDALRQGRITPGSKVLMVPAASGVVAGFLSVTIGELRV